MPRQKTDDHLRRFEANVKSFEDIKLRQLEIKQIAKVIGLNSGHWYQCPNGHIYAIGECGGAMEQGKCPDCGSVIGGASHRLAEGNSHAGWIDGSRGPAYNPDDVQGNLNAAIRLQREFDNVQM